MSLDQDGVCVLLVGVAWHPRLREDLEAGPGVGEGPGGQLDLQVAERGEGVRRRGRHVSPAFSRWSARSNTSSRRTNCSSGRASSETKNSAICACQRALTAVAAIARWAASRSSLSTYPTSSPSGARNREYLRHPL